MYLGRNRKKEGKSELEGSLCSVVCIHTSRGTCSHDILSNTGYLYKGQMAMSLDSERNKYILCCGSCMTKVM